MHLSRQPSRDASTLTTSEHTSRFARFSGPCVETQLRQVHAYRGNTTCGHHTCTFSLLARTLSHRRTATTVRRRSYQYAAGTADHPATPARMTAATSTRASNARGRGDCAAKPSQRRSTRR